MRSLIICILLGLTLSKPIDNDPELGDHFEGDILIDANGLPTFGPFNAIVNKNLRWPSGILHYSIVNSQYTPLELQLIQDGIDDLMELTKKPNGEKCVDLRPRTTQFNYVVVEKGGGCSSFIGRIGGAQRMSLASGCVTRHGTIMHEFLHALGFYHEQSRGDRDEFVRVNYDNIIPGRENNFRKLVNGVSIDHLETTYDYGSVMHYGRRGFAIDPSQDTITPLDPSAEIGQRITLSELDIERVQILYGCLNAKDSKYFKNLAGYV